MEVRNTTRGDLGLSFDCIVPAGRSMEVDNDRLTELKASLVVKAWFIEGKLVEEGAADAKPRARQAKASGGSAE